MGYIIATIAAVIILLLVAALLLGSRARSTASKGEEPSSGNRHGLSYEEPQDEGVPGPLARERDKGPD